MSVGKEQIHRLDWRWLIPILTGGISLVEPPRSPTTPLEWLKTPTVYPEKQPIGPESEPKCQGIDSLYSNINKIVLGAQKEKSEITFVSGLICTRTGTDGEKEVLLVRGGGKDFYQPIGGKVNRGEGHVAALHREVQEEVGLSVPETVAYHSTYVQQDKKFAVHAFIYDNCPWTEELVRMGAGSDVDENKVIWTKDFIDKDGNPMELTEQANRVLTQLGFKVPKNKRTPPDDYDGAPWK